MNIVEQIKSWAEEVLEPSVFVVDIAYKPGGGKILVLIDSDGPLTIEQCRSLNRHLSNKLDETDYGDTPYILEVSSPGVDRPLILKRQYQKHIGREIRLILVAQTELVGKLLGITENSLTLLLKDPKKAYKAKEPIEKTIEFNDIEETYIMVSFN